MSEGLDTAIDHLTELVCAVGPVSDPGGAFHGVSPATENRPGIELGKDRHLEFAWYVDGWPVPQHDALDVDWIASLRLDVRYQGQHLMGLGPATAQAIAKDIAPLRRALEDPCVWAFETSGIQGVVFERHDARTTEQDADAVILSLFFQIHYEEC